MQFYTGPRFKNGSIVVESQDLLYGPTGRVRGKTPPLRVEVKDHFIDTDTQAKALKWDRDTLKRVNEHLINMVHDKTDGAHHRNVYLADGPQTKVDEPVSTKKLVTRCTTVIRQEGKHPHPCGKRVEEGKYHCPECLAKLEEAVA